MKPATVYVLQHVHELGEIEDVKLIGVYSTRASAEAAATRMRLQPGFAESPDGFHIDPYDLDIDHWTEGFITV